MRVAFYNQMFGFDGRSLYTFLRDHKTIHFNKTPDMAYVRSEISRTIDIIKKSKAEIVGICEILEGQEEKLRKLLKEIGYKYVFFGTGHLLTCGLKVKIALASKLKCVQKNVEGFPVESRTGGAEGLFLVIFLRRNFILLSLI